MNHVLELQKIGLNKRAIVLDFFAGSSSTAHAIIEMNKRDSGERKYLLMQTGNIFDSITKPRMIKAAYSQKWKDEKPIDRNGISQCFKYMRLEQYEDTLNSATFLYKKKNKALSSNIILKALSCQKIHLISCCNKNQTNLHQTWLKYK